MRDGKGLSPDAGRGADAGLRKKLLTRGPQSSRRMFRHYAECRNEMGDPANVLGVMRR